MKISLNLNKKMKSKKIVVIGPGGVGGYFGFKIAQKYENDKDVDVTFIARQETFRIIKENGLTLLSPEHSIPIAKPDHILENISEIKDADLILICVKEYDLERVCKELKDKINDKTVLLPLMNGVDIYDRIRKVISNGIVFPSCVYIASHIKEKGVIEHKGNSGKIIIGKDPLHNSYEPKWMVDLLTDCRIDVIYKDNSFSAIWIKFFFIASFGLVSARYNKSIGQINEEAELKERVTAIMREIEEIASKKAIDLPDNIVELTFQKAGTFPYNTQTSLQLDVQSKKADNELELFAGAIINYGKQLNTPVNETEKIYNEIKQMNSE